ncbi:MAG: transcriptional repressor LexA [bacterium]
MTKRQQMVLDFLKSSIQENGFAPSVREIAAYLKITSLKATKQHLDILERKGYINKGDGIARAIEILENRPNYEVTEIPVIGTIWAGNLNLAVEECEETVAVDSSLARWADAFFLRVKGESMIEAHIIEGDLALIRPQPVAERGEIIVAMVGEDATLKIYYPEKDHVRLQPANSSMEPILIYPDEPFRILGKMVGLYRKSSNIPSF